MQGMSDPNRMFQEAGEACGRGDYSRGVALYRALAAQLADHPQILSALGAALIACDQAEDGVATLRRALAIAEPQPDVWCNLARGLRRLGRHNEALAAADRALTLAPTLFEAAVARGNILMDMERLEEALAAYEKACNLRRDDPRVYFNCGNALLRLKRLQHAAGAFAIAVRLKPDYAEALLAQAKVLDRLGHAQDGLAAIDRALALLPRDVEFHFTRGTILASLDRKEEAAAVFGEILARAPSHAEAWRWRGLIYQKLRRYNEAVADLDHALALRPQYPEAEFDRACTLAELKRIDEALASYDRVLAMVPDDDLAVFNRATLVLLRGDFANGWRGYERRWAHKEAAAHLITDKPRWQGDGVLSGKTILVWGEQGYGDCVQFCRYVPMLAAMGAKVVLEVPARLVPLLHRLEGVSVIASGSARPAYDLQCPVMSLPLAFKTTLQTIPAQGPYLFAEPAKLAPGAGPRIGFVWAGNAAHDEDLRRAMPLAALEPLLKRPLGFHALQKDITPEDAVALQGWAIPQHSDEQNDFADAAALIMAMDLIITVDTAIAHVAGALGRPVWLMLPFAAEWRWLLDREDSPWYPTMRLFRQTEPGGWAGVVSRIGAALDRLPKDGEPGRSVPV